MSSSPVIRSFEPREWRTYRDLRLQALAQEPDAFCSTLASEERLSDAEWTERLRAGIEASSSLPLMVEVGFGPAGLAWGRAEPASPERADLYQMWVHPDARCLGAGALLLHTVIGWAKDRGARYLALGVTCGDTSAARLYARAGFQPFGQPEPLRPGSSLLAQEMRLEL